ncbi:hypothetical protein [Aureimonas sp. ME7]|uniref:CBU_0592 family membrane protein n=1 Tax=Aureimonas sp. ME7 TaxID=2744252 RepID=UPI0015F55705|nr:hypothetical protein [Aureimonas sp. ME7]
MSDAVGLVGVAAYLCAYGLLQFEKLRSGDTAYLLLNAAGSVLILVSLVGSFNLPSFVSQSFWLLFTLVGFYRVRIGRRGRPILDAVPEPDVRPAIQSLSPDKAPLEADEVR